VLVSIYFFFFFFQAEDGIRDFHVTGVQTCALPIYQDLIADKEVDAVVISTPDHWHAQPAMEAALAGKHVYLQKPTALTIQEGRMMADTVARKGIVFQPGSQQRSVHPWPQFKRTCE